MLRQLEIDFLNSERLFLNESWYSYFKNLLWVRADLASKTTLHEYIYFKVNSFKWELLFTFFRLSALLIDISITFWWVEMSTP